MNKSSSVESFNGKELFLSSITTTNGSQNSENETGSIFDSPPRPVPPPLAPKKFLLDPPHPVSVSGQTGHRPYR